MAEINNLPLAAQHRNNSGMATFLVSLEKSLEQLLRISKCQQLRIQELSKIIVTYVFTHFCPVKLPLIFQCS